MIKVSDIYPITITTYPNGLKSMECITDADLRDYTTPIKLRELEQVLMGQTRCELGVYATDVERWLNGREVTD